MITVYLILVLIFGIITGSSDASYQYNPEEIMYLAGIGKAAYEDDMSYSLYDMNGDGIPELFILNDSGDSGKLLEIYRYDALTNDALLVVSIDKVTDVYSKGDENGVYVSVSDALSEIYTDYELVNNEAEAQTVTKNSGEEHITNLLKNGAEPLFWVGSDQWVDGSIIGAAPRIPDPGPQNNFYLSSNYEWLSTEQIHKQGDITGMTDDQEEIVRRNKQEMFTNREKYQGADIQILRDYYDMAADWEKRDADGIEPVRKYLDAAYGVSSLDELTELLVNPELNPFSILLSFSITLDEEDTSHWAVELGEDNFSVLPRIYHNDSKEAIEEVQSDFDVMARHVLSRAGYPDPEIDNIMAGCYELEDILLPLAWPGDSDTDSPLSGFLPFDTVTSYCKRFPLKQLLNAYEITGGNIHVYYPGYLERLDEIYKEENLFILKAYLTAHTAAAAGMYLDFEAAACLEAADAPEKELKESFETGYQAEVLSSRGLLGVAEENAYMTFFADPETRSDLIELAGKVRDTFRVMLDHEDWMSDSGKAAAIEKLDNMTFCVMSPDVLIDSSYLAPDPDKSFLDNYAAITVSRMKHNGAFAGMPREKGDWRYDLRPEIASSVTNAFYYGVFNQFFILSGFVDDSVCNPDIPIEKKLASIGVIIGHELTHGFDPTGIRYDKDGNMVMTDDNPYGWMPEKDYQAFMKRAQRIADHIDTFILSLMQSVPDYHNGERPLRILEE